MYILSIPSSPIHLVILTYFVIIILSASAVDLLDFQCPSLLFFQLLFVMQWELIHTHLCDVCEEKIE